MAKKTQDKVDKKPKAKVVKRVKEKVKEKPVITKQEKTTDEITIEKRLIALYSLQQSDSQIDKIRIVRGELPLEVQDLEDEIAGLETRVNNYKEETESFKKQVSDKENAIKESETMIKKYEKQQMNVRNNREYDSLSKEMEFQTLEIQLSEKRIKETNFKLDTIKEEIAKSNEILTDRKSDLAAKKAELDDIVADTKKEENDLITKSDKNQKYIEDRLLTAYQRIRKNARNGLAVVQIERDACGGCFNKIPPQSQLDIRMHKKIIVCEYCGRILVDEEIVNIVNKDKEN
jgi:predicted  nucleic acid-binding Zn-ribbon protein